MSTVAISGALPLKFATGTKRSVSAVESTNAVVSSPWLVSSIQLPLPLIWYSHLPFPAVSLV